MLSSILTLNQDSNGTLQIVANLFVVVSQVRATLRATPAHLASLLFLQLSSLGFQVATWLNYQEYKFHGAAAESPGTTFTCRRAGITFFVKFHIFLFQSD